MQVLWIPRVAMTLQKAEQRKEDNQGDKGEQKSNYNSDYIN